MLTSHTQPVCFACPCHCYYPGTQYFFWQTHETAIITTMVGAFAFLIIRVLSLSAKLTCYFGRGIFTKFYVCGREEFVWQNSTLYHDTITIHGWNIRLRNFILEHEKSVKTRGLTGNPSLMPYKETDTFDYFNFYSYHSPGTKKRFVKGERYASNKQVDHPPRLTKTVFQNTLKE